MSTNSYITAQQRDRLAAAFRARGGRREAWHEWQRLSAEDRNFWRRDTNNALAFAGLSVIETLGPVGGARG